MYLCPHSAMGGLISWGQANWPCHSIVLRVYSKCCAHRVILLPVEEAACPENCGISVGATAECGKLTPLTWLLESSLNLSPLASAFFGCALI